MIIFIDYLITFFNNDFISDCPTCDGKLLIISTSIRFKNYKNFIKRLWSGLKYLFNHKIKFGYFDSYPINSEQANILKNMIKRAIDSEK